MELNQLEVEVGQSRSDKQYIILSEAVDWHIKK